MDTAQRRLVYMKDMGCMDRLLTVREAVLLLNEWRRLNIPRYNLDFSIGFSRALTSGHEYVFLNYLVDYLIKRIEKGHDDPITEVANYYYELDEVLAMSDDDHYITHRFASYMENATHDIMNYLHKKEKELNEHEHERMAYQNGR